MKKLWCSLSLLLFVSSAALAVPLTDKLIMHYRADALNLADGADVLIWPDLPSREDDSINATALPISGYGVPKFVASGYNGLPAVRFIRQADPTQPNLDKTVLQSANWEWENTKQSVCIFMVATGGKVCGYNQRSLHIGRVTGGDEIDCDMRTDSPNTTVGSGCRFNNGYAVTSSPFAEGEWHISIREIAEYSEHTTLFYAVNGTTPLSPIYTGSTTATYDPESTSNFTTLGGGFDTSGAWLSNEFYDGQIAEILVYSKLLTADEKQQVYNFLYNKYHDLTAHNPLPAFGAADQGTRVGNAAQVTLGWTIGDDPLDPGSPNPAITAQNLYIDDDPNFLGVTAIPLGSSANSSGPITLNPGTTYYWRVDEITPDPNIIVGPVWSFTTFPLTPRIDVQPTNLLVDLNATSVAFSMYVFSKSPVTYTWYKPSTATQNPATDPVVTMPIASVAASHEGYYYCKVTNDDSGEAGAVYSNTVTLGVKREVAHWTLDFADYVGSRYLDSSGEQHHADPNKLPLPSQFVNGVVLSKTAQALDLTDQPLAAAMTTPFAVSACTDQATVSMWVYWEGANGTWQGLIGNRRASVDGGSAYNFLIQLRNDNSKLEPYLASPAVRIAAPALPANAWTHVAVVFGPAGRQVYYDGVPVLNDTAAVTVPQNLYRTYLGCIDHTATTTRYPFNGTIDDIRVYNYAKDAIEIANLYYDITEKGVCVYPNLLDVAGGGTLGNQPDCRVNLADFAAFASNWLNCRIYPASACGL